METVLIGWQCVPEVELVHIHWDAPRIFLDWVALCPWTGQNLLWLIEFLLIGEDAVRIFLIGLGFVPEVGLGQSKSTLIDWILVDLWRRSQDFLDCVWFCTWGYVWPVRISSLICEGSVRISSDWLNSCWFVKAQSESSWLGWVSYLRLVGQSESALIDWILADLWRRMRSQNLLDWVGLRTWGWVRPVRICSDWLNSCWFVKAQSESSWLGCASYLRLGLASQNLLWLIEVLLICECALRIFEFLIGLVFVPEVGLGQSESSWLGWVSYLSLAGQSESTYDWLNSSWFVKAQSESSWLGLVSYLRLG